MTIKQNKKAQQQKHINKTKQQVDGPTNMSSNMKKQ